MHSVNRPALGQPANAFWLFTIDEHSELAAAGSWPLSDRAEAFIRTPLTKVERRLIEVRALIARVRTALGAQRGGH
jgi:hypothetical protein